MIPLSKKPDPIPEAIKAKYTREADLFKGGLIKVEPEKFYYVVRIFVIVLCIGSLLGMLIWLNNIQTYGNPYLRGPH